MGFSVSGATAILFVSMLLGLGMFYGSVSNGAEEVTDARDVSAEQTLDREDTDFEIVSIAYDDRFLAPDTVTVQATNTGTTALRVSSTDVLTDNEYERKADYRSQSVDGDPDTDLWLPDEVLEVEVFVNEDDDEPTRVTVVIEHGISDTEVR